jgi:hypothetical protein
LTYDRSQLFEKSFRATRDDTLRYQRELRDYIGTLIKENRPLKPEERNEYFDLIGKALLGCDIYFESPVAPYNASYLWGQQEYSKIKNVADFLRFMAYVEEQPRDNEKGYNLSYFWKLALESILIVSSKSLEVSTHISAELVPRAETKAQDW